jgi:DNA-binding beta-propeller fold protein YncE
MNESRLVTIVRALTDGAVSRRGLARGFAGTALATALIRAGSDDLAARKRKKGKKRKKRNRGNQGNGRGNGGGVENPCGGTICEGVCVDLNTDPKNCGACGTTCGDNACVGGLCVEIIGSRGSGEDQFEDPFGLAVNGDGVVYIADSSNARIVILGGGTFGNAEFVQPTALAVNQVTGDVYATDIGTHSVVRFAANGRVLGVFGNFGTGVDQFEFPLGIAVDPGPGGQIFIADTGNNRIQRMSASGFPLGRFGRRGSGQVEFDQPQGVALSADRILFVADTNNHRIQVLDLDGGFVRAFGTRGSGPGQFERPVALTFGIDGSLLVVDQGNNRIQQFTPDGQFLKALGSAGSGPGQFNAPTGIAVDEDAIGVVDTGNHRLQAFFRGGSAQESAGAAAPFGFGNDRAPAAAATSRRRQTAGRGSRRGAGKGRGGR